MSSAYLTVDNDGSSRSKRPRSSLACVRCRTKKVKCDFSQPTCNRCQASRSVCEYLSPPLRVDGQAFDRIGDKVEDILERMKCIQSNRVPDRLTDNVHWNLSVSPTTGIRIDTNIMNVNELHQILLNGISQLNINHRPVSPSISYYQQTQNLLLLHDQPQQISKETLDQLITSSYHSCFLAFTIIHPEEFNQRILSTTQQSKTKHKLLMNAIFAWVIKHNTTYHQLKSNSDAIYFRKARKLLEKCFVKSSPVTIHALLHLYMYQLLSDQADLAYLYIGLAIRMAQDLEFNKSKPSTDPIQAELNKRLWWSAYWLDLTVALESNRPTMVDDIDTDLDYPQKLDFEDTLAGDRINLCVYSIQLLRIRKRIIKTLPSLSGQALLASVAGFETDLQDWHRRAPENLTVLQIQYHTTWIVLHQHLLAPGTPISLLSWSLCQTHADMITQLLTSFTTHWCDFFFALDGVLTSIDVHKKSAEQERPLATANLLLTANILNQSPLTHMKKVRDLLTSIHSFIYAYQPLTPNEPQEMAVVQLNDPNSSLVNLSITPTQLFDGNAFEFLE